jgi:hypothetical protein
MSDITKPKLEIVPEEELDEEEREFRALRRDLPGVQGASSTGILTISVAKAPPKNQFFRTHPDFRPTMSLVDHTVGLERQFFAVTKEMEQALASIGISFALHTLYLTVTTQGAVTIVPVRHPDADGNVNTYARTKEIVLLKGIEEWVRMYTDQQNKAYLGFPAPVGRFPDAIYPELKPAKITRLAFRDKGRLLDSPEHPLFKQWSADK